ncbi:MAG: DUF1566 domain-containing protein [Sulfurospirillum sp.]|nr:DUF1566 domain-containing protein [Sulfurospirillum sp.]
MKKSILSLLILVSISSANFSRDDNKKIVTDSSTNLQWQDDDDAKSMKKSWENAIDYCEGLELGGYDDWHLPNKNELLSIADKSLHSPAISSIFQNIINGGYSSSTTTTHDTTSSWYINFLDGMDSYNTKTSKNFVRCVR